MALDLSLLNPQQRKAVVQSEGPVLVLAGAGSGKTRVIAHRVVHLLEQGVAAGAVLAVTFTNKAAAEMKERIVRLEGSAADAGRVTVSPFHAFGMRIVREEREALGLPAKFAVLDAGDQAALLKRLLRDLKVDDKRFDVNRLLGIISRLRMGGARGHPDDEYELCAAELLPKYQLGLRAMGAVDFDDLLLLPLALFGKDTALLQKYQGRYRYLLVDEYQDTNDAQLALLTQLAGLRRNLCVVGDDDQSIYGWRGAQARPFEEALRLGGVRYRVVGGTSLFDRKEVRDLVAYLRAALNPRDEVALLRIVNVPARGIGDQTVARAQELARARKSTVWDVFAAAPAELSQAAEPISDFVALMRKHGERLAGKGFSEAARALVEEVGLFDEARRSAQSLAAQARKVEAVQSLLRQLIEYEQREEQRAAENAGQQEDSEPFAGGLSGYLARLALDSREADGDAGEAVTLMTLHGAKGLEWRCVFLCGMEEGLLPHSGRGFDDAGPEPRADGALNLEEERRLCYVGMTRARERLILTRAAGRTKRGKPVPRTPSRFLEDIPAGLVDAIDLRGPLQGAPKEVQQAKARSFFASMTELLDEK